MKPARGTSYFACLGRARDAGTQHGHEGHAEDCISQRHQVVRHAAGGQDQDQGGGNDELHDLTMRDPQSDEPLQLAHRRIAGLPEFP